MSDSIRDSIVPEPNEWQFYLDLRYGRGKGLIGRKEQLAKRVTAKEELSNLDREEIAYFLRMSQAPPAVKRKRCGRPSKAERDWKLAYEYVVFREKDEDKSSLQKELKKKYKMSEVTEQAFFMAIKRGIAELEKIIIKVENSKLSNIDDLELIRSCKKSIGEYLEKSKRHIPFKKK